MQQFASLATCNYLIMLLSLKMTQKLCNRDVTEIFVSDEGEVSVRNKMTQFLELSNQMEESYASFL